MFDTVPRARLEAEQERRMSAEAQAASYSLIIATLNQQLATLGQLLKEQSRLHYDAQVDLLDRLEPKPDAGVPRLPDETRLKLMSAAEIRNQPAATRQEMMRRERLAREADSRERDEANERGTSRAAAALSSSPLPMTEVSRIHAIAEEAIASN